MLAIAGWLLIAVAALGVIDVANVFLVRRNLQRVADLAATAGAQAVGSSSSSAAACSNAIAAAQQNARANGFSAGRATTITVTCGRWDPSTYAAPTYFSASGVPRNAVQVVVRQQVSYFFIAGPAQTVQASGIAKASTIGAFSLGTSVATLDGGLVNGLLNALLGSNLSLDVLSYRSLAGASVKLGDLMAALNIGTVEQLLDTKLTVGQLATAMVSALSRGGAANATVVRALGTIAAAAPGGPAVRLGNTSATNGLLSIGLDDSQAAADASIGVLDALLVAAEIANGQNAVNLGAALNLGPIAKVSAQLRIVQPPVIAIGEAGQDASGNWRTSAHSAQVRLYLHVQVLNLNSPLLGLVGISALNLPIYIEAGQGTAYLQSTQCTTSATTSASVIVAQPGIAALCISDGAASNMTNVTTAAMCNTPATLSRIGVLGWPLLVVSAGSSSPPSGLSLWVQPASPTTLVFNGVSGDGDDYQSTNSNALGSETASLLGQVATTLPSSLFVSVGDIRLLDSLGVTLRGVSAGLVALLSPVLSSLDSLLVPLLQLLGVQIGVSTIHDISLTCGDAQLVH